MSKLSERIAGEFESKAAADRAVKAVMEGLAAELAAEGSVSVIGYLSINTTKKAGGEKIKVAGKEYVSKAKTIVKVKAGAKLIAAVN